MHRSGGGESVVTVYDEAGRWLGDYTAEGQAIQQAIWLDDLPVGLLVGAGSGQKLYYLQPDALGSARVAIDPVRDVAVWRWDLTGDIFGASAPNEDPDGDGTRFTLNLRFPGQQYDAATGLHYNYFRDYDPTVGRYLQSDPIGLLGGMSTYGYANGSPSTFTDPLGLRGKGNLGGRIGEALFRPIYQRLGGGAAARAASMAAKARAEARRAADMAQRMRTVLGRIFKGRSRKGGEPAGCDDIDLRAAERNSKIQLLHSLRQVVRQKAGFSNSGQAIILDENLAARGMIESLRAQGFNARSVQEIFGRGGIPDARIYDLSRMIDAKVLTRDVGRQVDGGFFDRAIVVDRRVRTPDGVIRVLSEGLK